MKLRSAAAALATAALVAVPTVAHSAPSRAASARKGAEWIASKQRANGSFGDASRSDLVGEMLAAVVAGGVGGRTVDRALDFIAKNGRGDATRPAYTGRMIAGIVAGGDDPRDHGGTDFVALLDASYDASTGAYDASQLFPNLLAANGKLAAGDDLPAQAIDHIRSNACPTGGFGYDNDCVRGPDVDTTSWAINVLVAAGADGDDTVDGARSYLLSVQRGDGGFGFSKSLPTSADSTGLALAAIAALDEDPTKSPWSQADGDDPVKALRRLQERSGAFRNSAKKPDISTTSNAVPGMAGVTYPIPHTEGTEPGKDPTPKPQPKPGAEPAEEKDGSDAERSAAKDEDPTDTAARDPSEDRTNSSRRTFNRTGDGNVRATPSATGAETIPGFPRSPRREGDAAQAGAPFAGTAEAGSDKSGGFPAGVLWGGVALSTIATGLGVRWLYLRGRP